MVILNQNKLALCDCDVIYIKQEQDKFILTAIAGGKSIFLGVYYTMEAAKQELEIITHMQHNYYTVSGEAICNNVVDIENAK